MKWITALNLEQWADSIPARTDFPALVLDLVRAAVSNPTAYRFPNGNKGEVRGFDGILSCDEQLTFVPRGDSIWEFGVSEDALSKAQDDYDKRTLGVPAEVRAKTTFVFVSPRTWNNQKLKIFDWERERRERGDWQDVRLIDGAQLEHWLDEHPAVASRYAREFLGLAPHSGAYSADEFWDEFSLRFEPQLVEEVLLAGRAAQASALLQSLTDPEAKIAYAADSPDEVIAFVVATVRKAPPELSAYLNSRIVVVDSEDAARFLRNKSGLIFLPRGQARKHDGMLAAAGVTVINAGADERRSRHDVLVRPTSSQLGEALELMYLKPSGYEAARKCGRSLAVLARQISSGTAPLPEWLGNSEALIPALLAGAWTVGGADTGLLTDMAGMAKYEEVEAPLRLLTKHKEPPIDRVGDVWSLRSSVDAFVHLGHLIGPEHLARLEAQFNILFSKEVVKPQGEQLFRTSASDDVDYSSWLKDGMMTTLLHMSALHELADFVVAGSTPKAFVDKLVRSLPGLVDYRFYASFKDNLPLLAEAAPGPFLDSLERLLEGDSTLIKPIFAETKVYFTSQSEHTGLLSALEVLAWEPAQLLRVTVCLARLAVLDPGGTLSNRPINSLREIFLPWSPNTNANRAQRDGILKHVLKLVPEIAWPLLQKLLPSVGDVSSNTLKPKFAEAESGGGEPLTYSVVWASQLTIIELAVKHAEGIEARWASLIRALGQMQPEAFDLVLVGLETTLGKANAAGGTGIWDALRKESSRHRAFPDAGWTLNPEYLARIDALVDRFNPDDPIVENRWLFDEWMPTVPGFDANADDPMTRVDSARNEAMERVFSKLGAEGILALASTVAMPLQMRSALFKLHLPEATLVWLLRKILSQAGDARTLAPSIVESGVNRFGPEFIQSVAGIVNELELGAAVYGGLLVNLEDNRVTWELIAAQGEEVEAEYWKQKFSPTFNGPTDDLIFLLDTYAKHGRALAALEVSVRRIKDVTTPKLLHLLDLCVREINAVRNNIGSVYGHYIEKVFGVLEDRGDVSEEELAQREYAYLPLFRKKKNALTLHRLVVKRPAMFMELVCLVYREEGAEPEELSPERLALVRAAFQLLKSLEILPGQSGQDVDYEALFDWCAQVRRISVDANRAAITDQSIGRLFAHSPADQLDGAWPHVAVRRAIEEFSSDEIERGIAIERFNMRGAYSKAMGEGGEQERALAQQSRDWASSMPEYPRTSALHNSIAKNWALHAQEEDVRSAKDALRW